jgi:periplasmic mercuric ion binding protein
LRDRFRQDGFKLDEVGEFTPHVRQMSARDLLDVGTRSALWPSQGQQRANFLKSEPEVAPCFIAATLAFLGVRLLAALPILSARLRGWRGLRAPATESHRQNQPHPRNDPRRGRARPRLHLTALSQLVTGELPMKKLLAHAAFAFGIIASPAVMAADRTITLAVNNMDCATCPSIVKGSLEAVPGVAKVAVSFKDKTATIVYDDAKADVNQLTSATTKAGHPSAPKS